MSIHPTALVDDRAIIGKNVSIGPFTIVHSNVEIGDDTVIESHCEIGHPAACSDGTALVIGERSLIRSHTVMYEGSSFGRGLVTGHGVITRDGAQVGAGFQIGAKGELQGDCVIGDYTRFQSDVIIGRKSIIGSFVWMFPRSGMMNDPMPPSNILKGATVHDYAVVGAYGILLPGVTVGAGAFIGAATLVSKDVGADRIACGNPMSDRGCTSRLRLPETRELARPWTEHFQRGYPEHVVKLWMSRIEHLAA